MKHSHARTMAQLITDAEKLESSLTIAKPYVGSSADFENAFSDFQLYKPVKVARELREEFHKALSNHFIAMGIDSWKATIYPLKNCYKFQRT